MRLSYSISQTSSFSSYRRENIVQERAHYIQMLHQHGPQYLSDCIKVKSQPIKALRGDEDYVLLDVMSSLLDVVEGGPSVMPEVHTRLQTDTLTVIVVLGCPPFKRAPQSITLTHRGEVDGTFAARVRKAADVYYDTPGRKAVITTGYQAAGFNESEAEAMSTLLQEHNIPSEDIVLEQEANSTTQNAIKCREIVRRMMKSNTIVNIIVVTSAFHMARTRYIFTRLYESDNTSFQLHFEESENELSNTALSQHMDMEMRAMERLMSRKHRIFEEALREGML